MGVQTIDKGCLTLLVIVEDRQQVANSLFANSDRVQCAPQHLGGPPHLTGAGGIICQKAGAGAGGAIGGKCGGKADIIGWDVRDDSDGNPRSRPEKGAGPGLENGD